MTWLSQSIHTCRVITNMPNEKETPRRIRELIKALMRRTTESGCTESEAAEAAAKVGALADQYGISMMVIAGEDPEEVIEQVFYATGKRLNRLARVCSAVAHYTDTKAWVTQSSHREDGQAGMVFLGREIDTEMAKYLLDLIGSTMNLEWETYARDQRDTRGVMRPGVAHLRPSFEIGMAERLSKRLYEEKRKRNAAEVNGKSVNALVVTKMAAVQDAFAKTSIKLRGRRFGAAGHDQAAIAGSKAADTVRLQRPVGHGNRERLT
jgi:hypothetical protein